jgi:hypothetical protein
LAGALGGALLGGTTAFAGALLLGTTTGLTTLLVVASGEVLEVRDDGRVEDPLRLVEATSATG